jgi:hypothetical protein
VDRWLEVDIDWFGDPPWVASQAEFVDRTLPLLEGERELRGVCFNIGWLADLVTEWSGSGEQLLPLRSRRYARWARLTYADLNQFLAELRAAYAARGLADIKLGVLIAGLGQVVAPPDTGSMYDLYTNWYERHPELYPLDISPLPGPDLDPRVPMRADAYPYATRPGGIAEGDPFPEFFGAQWGSVAAYLGLDLIHLRDGMFGALLYTRVGPYGAVASSDPAENRAWTDAYRRLFRACKDAHPEGLVMTYSSGLSGTAEWLTGCTDLETIVADGALDIFVDQTWGGAWQDWWDDTWKGWTFQLAYLLGHAAQIRGGSVTRAAAGRPPCRQYNLIETWDGWEPWDTLHDTPGKLEWAMWAFDHAAVIGPEGRPITAEGTYISWMNDWNKRLISERDVDFLATRLAAAEQSAAAIEEVFGPTLVHDRAGLEAKYKQDPASNASEWVEDQAGMLLKWGAGFLAASRPEWLPADTPDGLLWQLPARVVSSRLAGKRGPLVASGRADRIDPAVLSAAGLELCDRELPDGYRLGAPTSKDLAKEERVHLPQRREVAAGPDSWIGYASDGVPLLAGRNDVYHWQPPDLADPGNPLVPHSQIGSVNPYVEAARLINDRAAASDGFSVEQMAAHEPVTVGCWRSAGRIHLLLGNLESGWMGDSRFARRATVHLPRQRFGLHADTTYRAVRINGDAPDLDADPDGPQDTVSFSIDVPPQGCVVLRVEAVA